MCVGARKKKIIQNHNISTRQKNCVIVKSDGGYKMGLWGNINTIVLACRGFVRLDESSIFFLSFTHKDEGGLCQIVWNLDGVMVEKSLMLIQFIQFLQ